MIYNFIDLHVSFFMQALVEHTCADLEKKGPPEVQGMEH